MLMTTSLVTITFSKVCLVELSLTRRLGEQNHYWRFATENIEKAKGR